MIDEGESDSRSDDAASIAGVKIAPAAGRIVNWGGIGSVMPEASLVFG